MKAWHFPALLGLYCGAAAALTPQDFVNGMTVDGDAEYPVWELEVPDAVYAGVLGSGLIDLRVFNAQQQEVPHAICRSKSVSPVESVQGREYELPVFPLRVAPTGSAEAVDVDVAAPAGSEVRVEVDAPTSGSLAEAGLGGYVIDAGAVDAAISAIRLRWATADGASEVAVRVEQSDTLDQWSVVVPQSRLVRLAAEGATLERSRIAVPPARYRYLRLVRVSDGLSPTVEAVIAETLAPPKGRPLPLRWFAPAPGGGDAKAGFDYGTAYRAPVQSARIVLPARNPLVALRLQSRGSTQADWVTRWEGRWSNLAADSADGAATVMPFAATADPFWRIQITDGIEAFGAAAPVLQLGYVAERLRFVTQGGGPYTLAYGSGRVKATEQRDCDWWRGTVSAVGTLLGKATAGPPRTLGGDAAKQPLAEPPPVQRYVLWAVLVLGTLLLLAMAFSLLRRLRPE